MKTFCAALGVIGGLVGLASLCAACLVGGCVCDYGNRTAAVVSHEVDPAVLLKKYEWFKDAAAALDAKGASVEVYEARAARLKKDYEGKPRSAWSREDREQSNLW